MKKVTTLLIALCLLFSLGISYADNGYYTEEYYRFRASGYGIVICTNISVRENPNTSAKRYGQLHNGNVVRIVEYLDGWYGIDLSTLNLKDVSEGIGYVKSSLVKDTPYWIVLTKYTYIYDDPWWTGNCNGEFSAKTPLLVKSENNQFYCVQTKNGTAGSSFVLKNDVGRFTNECEPGYAVIVGGPIYATSYFDPGYTLGKLDTGEIVQVVEWGPVNSHIYYTHKDGTLYDAYVPTMNIQPIIN